VELTSGEAASVLAEETVELVRLGDEMYTIVGRVKGQKGKYILLERIIGRSGDARRSLRVPIDYDTYIYPADGTWEGRCLVKCKDLSCGGIAFHLPMELTLGERVDVVVRTQEEPLVIRGEVLRQLEKKGDMRGYAVCFRDICPDEDALLCKEVFGVQLRAAFADKRNR
ncbi:MAG: PilZ domain-containing protein, partial [Oscillospiraceae bacterium]|nr:PilZ domain-containing protein [Oscillospiraceae bacterium]